jgi:predicted transglutaminase-like cysteine proteinase
MLRQATWIILGRRLLLALFAIAVAATGALARPDRSAPAPTQGSANEQAGAVREASRAPALEDAEPAGEPFGFGGEASPEGSLWSKWRAVEAEIRDDAAVLARCRADAEDCPPAARRFLDIAAQSRGGRARIGEINRAINLAIRPASDTDQHGAPDRWTAPLATLAAGRGDCEDYAIAKYAALREAGLASEDMRLVVVRDLRRREDHALLAVRLDGRWLTLDNRRFALLEDRDVARIAPLFSLDAAGVKRFVDPHAPRMPRGARAHVTPADGEPAHPASASLVPQRTRM